jgi:hypothetical protein
VRALFCCVAHSQLATLQDAEEALAMHNPAMLYAVIALPCLADSDPSKKPHAIPNIGRAVLCCSAHNAICSTPAHLDALLQVLRDCQTCGWRLNTCTACSGGPSLSTCTQCQQTQMPVCNWLRSCVGVDGTLEVYCGTARATVQRYEPRVVHCGAARVTVQHG